MQVKKIAPRFITTLHIENCLEIEYHFDTLYFYIFHKIAISFLTNFS
jgi:hypothetical protein